MALRKQLIIHCDDIGLARAVNVAAFTAFDLGAITSGSVMVPCPYFAEAAQEINNNRAWDIGIHITLTSEWKPYRWSPISPREKVPTLVDRDGYLFRSATELATYAAPAQVEVEMRAQIERALELGIRPSHLDSHMFAIHGNPCFVKSFGSVASEYTLPFTLKHPRDADILHAAPAHSGEAVDLKRNLMLRPPVKSDEWMLRYADLVKSTEVGINQLLVHLGSADAELRGIAHPSVAWGAAWRQRDLEIITSKEFQDLLKSEDIELIDWTGLVRQEGFTPQSSEEVRVYQTP